MARPSEFNEDTAKQICDRLVDGESLRTICADDAMPARSTVHLWLAGNAEFSDQYARARERQADTLFDEILDIADDGSNDWMAKFDEDGGNIGWRENGEALQRSKLRVDARKWMASKLAAKKYGDKTLIGSDPDNPLPAPISNLEAAQRIAYLLSSAAKPS